MDLEQERTSLREEMLKAFGKTYGNSTYIEITTEVNALAICTGDEFQPIEIKSRLRCHLESKRHPYFILNPLKTEVLSEYPLVIQFYDVIGNDIIEEVTKMRDKLELSTINIGAARFLDLSSRSSAGAVLSEDTSEKIRFRSGMITGLVADVPDESIQTVEYVYGRALRVHSDRVLFW